MFKLWSLALALLVGAGVWAAPATAGSSEVEELERQIADLRTEIDGLKSVDRQGGDEGTPMSTALKGHLFSWSSEDGKFAFMMQTDIKVRLTYNDERGGGEHASRNARDFINFSIPLADTTFKGHIFEKEYKYKMQVSWNNVGGNTMFKDVYFTWAKWKFLNVNVGQHKLPFNWEKMTSDTKGKFIDRSVVNEMFHEDYAKGLWLNGEFGEDTPWVRYWIGIYNGVLRATTDFRNADRAINGNAFADTIVDNDLMLNLRVETHPMGEVEMDMQDMRGEDERSKIIFAVGVGFNWFIGRHAPFTQRPDTSGAATANRFRTGHDTMTVVLDGHFRWMGLSFDFEFFMRHTEFHNFGANDSTRVLSAGNHGIIGNNDDMGFSMEIGYMILPNQLGVGVRWSHFDADEHWTPGAATSTHRMAFAPDMDEFGLVVNYYLAGHNLKGQFDFTYVANQLAYSMNYDYSTLPVSGAPDLNGVIPASGIPARGTTGPNDLMESDYENAWQIRLQIQWIF